MLLGYIIQDWQDFNIAVYGCEGPSDNPNKETPKKVTMGYYMDKQKRYAKPVHFPCVYYKAKWECSNAFKERIIQEHPQLTLDMFVGL